VKLQKKNIIQMNSAHEEMNLRSFINLNISFLLWKLRT
jgi:hypothetical protein